MTETIFYIVAALLVLLLVVRLTRGNRPASEAHSNSVQIEDLFPHHAWHFDQIRQAISDADLRYLAARASPECCRRVRKERQQIIRQYVQGLREDFEHLEQLGRTVAVLSPEVSHKMELERLRLTARFRFMLLLVSVRMRFGISYARPLEELANMVGTLASDMDAVLARLERLSA